MTYVATTPSAAVVKVVETLEIIVPIAPSKSLGCMGITCKFRAEAPASAALVKKVLQVIVVVIVTFVRLIHPVRLRGPNGEHVRSVVVVIFLLLLFLLFVAIITLRCC